MLGWRTRFEGTRTNSIRHKNWSTSAVPPTPNEATSFLFLLPFYKKSRDRHQQASWLLGKHSSKTMPEDHHELLIRRGIVLNNVGVALLENSHYTEAWTTCHDAIQVIKLSLPPNSSQPGGGVGSSSLTDGDGRRFEATVGKARKALDLSTTSSSRVCGSPVGAVICFDPTAVPDLNLLQHPAGDAGISPIKFDLQACPTSSPFITQEVVSGIILYNLALVNCLLDANPPSGKEGGTQHPSSAGDARKSIKLFSLSMDLIHKRLESTQDVSEQVGLLFLVLLSLQSILWLLQYRCPEELGSKLAEMQLYAGTRDRLLQHARILACLEVVTIQVKSATAPVA